MLRNIKKIHVFSMFPNLSSRVIEKLPKTTVVNVINKNNDPVPNDWKRRVVSSDEFSEIKDAEVILGDANLIAQVYKKLHNIKFVQCTWAGVELLADQVDKEELPKFPIARLGSEKFHQYLVEYTLGQILIKEREWIESHHYQLEKTWVRKDKIAFYKSLQDITVGVLGVGAIGSEVVRALKYFKCRVLGLGRSRVQPPNVPLDEYFPTTELPEFLKECDYIVNVLPLTPDTKELLGKDMLSFAKKKPVFINIGRAEIISENEIISALDKSWISAAVLDVFEDEPLPTSSPLWSHPKVTLTPHVAAPNHIEDMAEGLVENLKRYCEGKPLLYLINWKAGY